MTAKAMRFVVDTRPPTPCLVLDVDRVAENYAAIREAMPYARVFYAVKANPALPILRRLVGLGSSFDVASWNEVEACLRAGADPARISFGTTIKKAAAIRAAHAAGVGMFAFDSEPELRKIAECAAGAAVYCRLAVDNTGAACPLSRKFGTSPGNAVSLLVLARTLGLDPCGVSFHVGSQQRTPDSHAAAVHAAGQVFGAMRDVGIELRMLNLGGGFPASYRESAPAIGAFGDAIGESLDHVFGARRPDVICEPGRAMVADAGVLHSEVVLASEREPGEGLRWVYLDVGRFGGLAETEGEAIRYDIRTDRDGGETGPVVLAGPTCDSMDTLYKESGYRLPLELRDGDRVTFLAAGAYVTTYASQGFNGFQPPLEFFV
jgi:ornithine decarboxylase